MVTGLALKVAEGERAVAVKVDESIGAGNRIRPGDFVDVFFVLRRDGNEIDQSQARLLLSRKRVLAYGAASVDALSSAEKTEGKQANGPDNARTAVLAVPVAEVSHWLGRLQWQLAAGTAQSHGYDRAGYGKVCSAARRADRRHDQGSVAAALEGADAAQAGVAMSSLAGSAGTSAARMSAAKPMTAGVAKPAVPRTRTASADSSLPVEFVRGANSQTVRY
jgi:pilus assembly protein CpaB